MQGIICYNPASMKLSDVNTEGAQKGWNEEGFKSTCKTDADTDLSFVLVVELEKGRPPTGGNKMKGC
jgi:hypothetical protein